MLRSLGSSLVAKASPGSASRAATENRMSKPNVPGKGAPGSTERQFVEGPKLNDLSPGSEKSIRVSPGADYTSQPGQPPVAPVDQTLLPGGIGMMPGESGATAPGQLRSGANNQPLFQGGVTPSSPLSAPTSASAAVKGGKTAKAVSGGALPGAFLPPPAPPQADIGMMPQENTQSQSIAPSERVITGTNNPLLQNLLGGRVSADEPGKNNVTIGRTAGQVAAGAAGKVITPVAQAVNKVLGTNISLAPSGLGAQLQSFGGATAPAILGQGSISNALRSLVQSASNTASNLRSSASNTANSVVSKLRSLFGR